ncbi:MAG: hypothetical protein ABII01_00090 [Candidatus Woesearchaeota archaeon]
MKKPDWKLWMKDKKECRKWIDNYIKKKILRKTKEESRLYLKKSDHNLNFANWIIEKHKDDIPALFDKETFYDWAISIYYYAIYHAALSLISREGYTSKNHSATLCFLIYYHYHSDKSLTNEDVELVASSLSKEDIETVGFSKDLREKACYDIHESFEKELSQNIRGQTIDFVNKIKEMLEQ